MKPCYSSFVIAVFVSTGVAVFAGPPNPTPVSGTGVFSDTDRIPGFSSEEELDEYVATCLRPTWEDIMRYPDDYIGKDVAVQGRTNETESKKTQFLSLYSPGRVGNRGKQWLIASWNQSVRPRGLFLKGDNIVVFGRLRATDDDESDILCPRVDARYIELVSSSHSIDDIIAERVERYHKAQAKKRAESGGKAEFKWRTERISSGGLRIFCDRDCLGTAYGEVVVPATIDGVPVRIVGDRAFNGFDSITKVTLPPEIRAIGRKAFAGCSELVSLQVGNIHYIAEDAFEGCVKLMRVITPEETLVLNAQNSENGCETIPECSGNEVDVIQDIIDNMVLISGKNYMVGKFEVTQTQWEAVMGDNPSRFKGSDNPVENISWDDCETFLEKLNALPSVKKSGLTFRLPTEEEWEYACRAGSTGKYCKLANGTEITKRTLEQVAWFDDNSGDKTHPVGQKKPNAWGLYDIHGNVWEWTSTAVGGRRVNRGGGWGSSAWFCESSNRGGDPPSYRSYGLGFRLCASSKAD